MTAPNPPQLDMHPIGDVSAESHPLDLIAGSTRSAKMPVNGQGASRAPSVSLCLTNLACHSNLRAAGIIPLLRERRARVGHNRRAQAWFYPCYPATCDSEGFREGAGVLCSIDYATGRNLPHCRNASEHMVVAAEPPTPILQRYHRGRPRKRVPATLLQNMTRRLRSPHLLPQRRRHMSVIYISQPGQAFILVPGKVRSSTRQGRRRVHRPPTPSTTSSL